MWAAFFFIDFIKQVCKIFSKRSTKELNKLSQTMKNTSYIIALLVIVAQLSFAGEIHRYATFEVEILEQGTPVFLIPGATCSGDIWESTLALLSQQYECHVFTLAGYAGVEPLENPPYLPTIKKALRDYISEVCDGQKAAVIGHSIGGYLALQMASEQPDVFDKLLIVDALTFLPAARNPAITEEQIRNYPIEAMVQQYQQMDSLTFRQMQQQVVGSMVGNKEFHEQVLGWSLTSDRRTMAYTVNEMMRTDLRQEIAAIHCPVPVLGAWDEGYPQSRQATQQIYQEQYNAAQHVDIRFPASAYHFIMLDTPKWYAEQLTSFFIKLLDHE